MTQTKPATEAAKDALALVLAAAFAATGIWIGDRKGYVIASFFGFGAVVMMVQLMRRRRANEAAKQETLSAKAPVLSASQQWLMDSVATQGPLERRDRLVTPPALSLSRLRDAVQELAGGDGAVWHEVEASLAGDGVKPANVWRDVLARHGRIAYVDWRAGLDEALAQFQGIFETSKLEWPGAAASDVEALYSKHEHLLRHDPIAVVYYVLREVVDRAGLEILTIDSDTDEFAFVLAPRAAADRWRSVYVGDGTWVESPERDFADTFKNVGWELRWFAGSDGMTSMPPTTL